MKRFSDYRTLTRRLRYAEDGSIVPTFALSLMAIFLSVGVAVDYSRIAHSKSVMTSAIDGAILSAAREMSRGETDQAKLEKIFKDYFEANLVGQEVFADKVDVLSFKADDKTGKVDVDINAELPSTFLAIAGWDKFDIPIKSQATVNIQPVEISFVLDVTGSMGWGISGGDGNTSRMAALKVAATNAVNSLFDGAISDRVTIGVVPYSASVNVGDRKVLANGTASPNGCVVGRIDREYSAEPFSSYPLFAGPTDGNCPTTEIEPLTSDKTKIINKIASLTPNGYTAGQEGIAWGHYMLSNKVGIWENTEIPRPDGSGTRKIAILMTDGEFNTYLAGPSSEKNWSPGNNAYDSNQSINKSKQASRGMCNEMKSNGIEIYSVVFGADAPSNPLFQCASLDENGDKRFYRATTADQLNDAFNSIASEIKGLYLSS